MTRPAQALHSFLAAHPLLARIEVMQARGSTPREEGAWMLVAPEASFGTIGGGQLEFMAIAKAREVLARTSAPSSSPEGGKSHGEEQQNETSRSAPPLIRSPGAPSPRERGEGRRGVALDIPLGPEIGQCCGGRVALAIELVDVALRDHLIEAMRSEDAKLPHVYMFGGGHVGHALAAALALLPVKAVVVESRAEALEDFPHDTETHLTPVPEEFVRAAPAGSAFVVLTHDHALDFLIVAEALKRKDAAYVGMIGSATKKATFKSWYLKTAGGSEADFARLVTPIGGGDVRDKRPAVIAALAAAEIMRAVVRKD